MHLPASLSSASCFIHYIKCHELLSVRCCPGVISSGTRSSFSSQPLSAFNLTSSLCSSAHKSSVSSRGRMACSFYSVICIQVSLSTSPLVSPSLSPQWATEFFPRSDFIISRLACHWETERQHNHKLFCHCQKAITTVQQSNFTGFERYDILSLIMSDIYHSCSRCGQKSWQ